MALDYSAYVLAKQHTRNQFEVEEPHRQVAHRAPRHVPSWRHMLADIIHKVADRLELRPANAVAQR